MGLEIQGADQKLFAFPTASSRLQAAIHRWILPDTSPHMRGVAKGNTPVNPANFLPSDTYLKSEAPPQAISVTYTLALWSSQRRM